MTVQNIPAFEIATGNGVVVEFTYTFYTLEDNDLVVLVDTTLQVQDVDYTLDDDHDPDAPGGTVTFGAAPTGTVLMQRSVTADQLTDYDPYDPFPAKVLESDLDKLTMLIQQINENLSSSSLGNKMQFDPDLAEELRVWIGRGLLINNIADPVDLQDALTLNYALDNQLVGGIGPIGLPGPAGFGSVVTDADALRTILGPLDTEIYLTSDDGGIWYFDASSTATDNDGTVVEPADATQGAYLRRDSTILSAGWFIDDFTGATDQATNMQAAIDFVESVGGTLDVPAGLLRLDTGLTVDISQCSIRFNGTKIDASLMSAGYLFSVTGGVDDIAIARTQITRFIDGFIAAGPGNGDVVDLFKFEGTAGENSSGPARMSIKRCYGFGFRHMLSFGVNSFLLDFENCGFVSHQRAIYAPKELDAVAVTNAGERTLFRACIFGGDTGVGVGAYIEKGEFFFHGCSFDALERNVDIAPSDNDAPRFYASQCHFESVNDNGWTSTPFRIQNTGTSKGNINLSQCNVTKGLKSLNPPEFIFENASLLGTIVIDGWTRFSPPDTSSGFVFGGSGEFVIPSIYKDVDGLSPSDDIFGESINKMADGGMELAFIADQWNAIEGASDVTIELDAVNVNPFGSGAQSLKITGASGASQAALTVPVRPGQAVFMRSYYEVSDSVTRHQGWCKPSAPAADGTINLGRTLQVGQNTRNDQSWAEDNTSNGQDRCPTWATHWYWMVTLGTPPGETYNIDDMIVNIV